MKEPGQLRRVCMRLYRDLLILIEGRDHPKSTEPA
jgi:hypothetical protein